MLSRISIVPFALVALGASQLASAADYDEGQWVTSFMAGSQLIPQGSFSPRNARAVNGASVTRLDHLQFDDAFRPGLSFSVESGYMSEANVEPFVRLSYAQMDGRNTGVGSILVPALDSSTPISARFDDLKSWTLDLGMRYLLADTGTMRPYVAGYVGANRTDALRARVSVDGQPLSGGEEFLPRATRFDAGVEGGVAWALSQQADLSLSIGAQYVNARRAHTDAFAPVGLESVRFSDPRWSIPVDLGLNFRF